MVMGSAPRCSPNSLTPYPLRFQLCFGRWPLEYLLSALNIHVICQVTKLSRISAVKKSVSHAVKVLSWWGSHVRSPNYLEYLLSKFYRGRFPMSGHQIV